MLGNRAQRLIGLLALAIPVSVMAQVPTLDSLAGHWMSGDEVVNPPSVTNTTGAIGCSENLTGFRYGNFPPIAMGGEAAELLVNGKPLPATRFRWYPYQAKRATKTEDGLEWLCTTRLGDNAPIVLTRLEIRNGGPTPVTVDLALRNHAGWRLYPGVWDWSNRGVNPDEGFSHSASGDTEEIADLKTGIKGYISGFTAAAVTLAPGQVKRVDVLFSFEKPADKPFSKLFEAAKEGWNRRWRDAFTPGNRRYSGNFPTLVSSNAKLKRIYYMALMTMLQMERTSFPRAKRCFVTVGPIWGTTLEYFWDVGLFPTVYSLLDPEVFRQNIESWLKIDIHAHYAEDYLTGQGVGPWYAPNDLSLFAAFWAYGTTLGDTAFLRAHRDSFVKWADFWKTRVHPGETLADFGENDNLLECGPKYVNMIPSLNGAHVGLMRAAAQLCSGDEAASLNADADRLANAVLAQYVPGDGVWRTKHNDGSTVVSRHVYDYVTIGLWMTSDLTPTMRREMTAFVNRELLADGWIRAMSLSDEAAPISDRPDHGPKGSYCAWPAMAAETMAKFGQYDDMQNLIERCEGATWQGPFPQAFELLQVPGTNRWIPRISLRGADYNESSGTAFAETVIHGLFGIEFDIHGEITLTRPTAGRPVSAKLLNVRTKAGLKNYACDAAGVHDIKSLDFANARGKSDRG